MILSRLIGSPWLLTAAFAAGLASGGWGVWQAWSVADLQRQHAALSAALDAERTSRRVAQEMAAKQAKDAQVARERAEQTRMAADALIAEYRREQADPKGCHCGWRPGDADRLLRDIPVRRPPASPAPGRGDDGLPRPWDRSVAAGGGDPAP